MRFPPTKYQFMVGTFAALGSLLYGYDLTIVAKGKSANVPSPHPVAGTDGHVRFMISGIQRFFPGLLQPIHH